MVGSLVGFSFSALNVSAGEEFRDEILLIPKVRNGSGPAHGKDRRADAARARESPEICGGLGISRARVEVAPPR